MSFMVCCGYTFRWVMCPKLLDTLYLLLNIFRSIRCIFHIITDFRFFSFAICFLCYALLCYLPLFRFCQRGLSISSFISILLSLYFFFSFSFLNISISIILSFFIRSMSSPTMCASPSLAQT